ncbi:MBL fold metallo-hydrolase [Methylobacterium nodulans]|uniref:Beta-lactamase domain protein n=1 Tax=Methylobacterium nodulans (strain LMG 21967 / CNCM I-2342 / ORS 2060) TaxID=460265 RepID=B8IFU0_METNO|nr:MBL fold metallo-hydrolase [Methylobacterium nodulans]ACL59650.1 beta-lactamase domain protein [Methylobacterium nodulans ORS 2060]
MPIQICVTCGTSFPDAPIPPERCPICDEERQYVPATGQSWTTPDALSATHSNAWRQREPDLFEIRTVPSFGIGQRAFLIRTPHGNMLWDCLALLDDATVALVRALGGLSSIAISHPHYYTTMQDWAAAFDAPVYLHARDREWVMRPDHRLLFWEEDERAVGTGLTLIRLGGHFPGGTVLHWQAGADRRGALMAGDILQVGADRRTVSFLWSYPNRFPLSGRTVARIASRLDGRRFERVYGAFGLHIERDGRAAVLRSADRYRELLAEEQP